MQLHVGSPGLTAILRPFGPLPLPGENGLAVLAQLNRVTGDVVLQCVVQGGAESADIEMVRNDADDGRMRRELQLAFLGAAVREDAHSGLRPEDVIPDLALIDRETFDVLGEKLSQFGVRRAGSTRQWFHGGDLRHSYR